MARDLLIKHNIPFEGQPLDEVRVQVHIQARFHKEGETIMCRPTTTSKCLTTCADLKGGGGGGGGGGWSKGGLSPIPSRY